MIPRVLIVHQHVGSDALVSDRDVLEQVAVVEQACRAAGWPVEVCETSLDFTRVDQLLTSGRFDVVFNLVESLAGSDQLASRNPGSRCSAARGWSGQMPRVS